MPGDVFEKLRTTAVTPRERSTYEVSIAPPGILAGLHELRWLYERHRELGRSPVRFPDFIRHVLGAQSLAQLAAYAASEGDRRNRQFLGKA